MAVQAWFPTCIYSEPLQKRSLSKFNQEIIETCYLVKNSDLEGQEWSKKNYVGGYTSFSSISELHKMSSLFMELEEKILKHVMLFADHLEMDLGHGNLAMSESWLNIMPSQTSHGMHLHPQSVISGTYYG